MSVPAVILAGGRAKRMGGCDKCLLTLDGVPVLRRILATLAPQCSGVLLNANGNPARFAAFAAPVLPDAVPGFAGPLAGLLTGMAWARAHHPQATHIVSVAGDMPFLPDDLVARLSEGLEQAGAEIAFASDGDRDHPVIGLWPVRLAPDLERTLRETDVRAVHRWMASYRIVRCRFPDDTFANLNTPDDLARAQSRADCDKLAPGRRYRGRGGQRWQTSTSTI